MANPVTTLLEHINYEVAKLSTVSLSRVTEVLDMAELELTKALSSWHALGKGSDRFTPQVYRNALVQIRGTLEHIRGPLAEGVASALRHGGPIAANLATNHLINEITSFSSMFEGSVRPIAIEAASVLADGQKLVYKRFENSAKRYAGAVGEDIRKQLAVGVVRGETIDQLTTRLAKMGGPKGLVYTRGAPGTPGAKAEYIAEGLFTKYRHFAERLAVTETVNAYNSFAMEGMQELEENDPGYFKRWDAAIDSRTCPQCGSYDDLVVKMDARFPGGVDHPPLHPRCRCAVVVWRKEWSEANHKDDLVGETMKGHEPKGVASIPHRIEMTKPKAEPKAPKAPKPPKEKKETKKAQAIREKAEKEAAYAKYQEEKLAKRAEAIAAHKAILDKHTNFMVTLTEKEAAAVKAYVGSDYTNINSIARTGKLGETMWHKTAEDLAAYKAHLPELDKAILKAPLKETITVYRGTYAPEIFKDAEIGDIFGDKGFTSTARDLGSTTKFQWGPNKEIKGGTLFHIEVPKGYYAAPVNEQESEMLLPRNTKFQIQHVSVNEDGVQLIKVKVVVPNE